MSDSTSAPLKNDLSFCDTIQPPSDDSFRLGANLHPDLWPHLFQFLAEPFSLAMTCKTLFCENLLWWFSYKLKNETRGYRYKWETTSCSDADDPMAFWIPLWSEAYEKTTNYYKKAQGLKTISWPILTSSPEVRNWDHAQTKAQKEVRQHRFFGTSPVLMVCSYTGDQYQSLLKLWGVDTIPMHERCEKKGISGQQPDFMGSNGWPGWEQCAGYCNDENLEILSLAYGGSDPGGRNWDRFANIQLHTVVTYKKLVGIVLVTEILQFDFSLFQRFILLKLPEVIKEEHEALPVLILCEKSRRGYEGPNRQMLWRDGEFKGRFWGSDEIAKIVRPVGLFVLEDYQQGLNWLYQTRVNMINNRQA